MVGNAAQHLQWSIQALAQRADVQLRLFPAFVIVADELALDFENWYRTALTALAATPAQREALAALDAALNAVDQWDDEALGTDPRWEHVRQVTRFALAAFQWPESEPPPGRSTFIPGLESSTEPGPESGINYSCS